MKKFAIVVFAMVVNLAGTARAATVTWDGSTDTTWTQPDPTSWSGSTYSNNDTALFGDTGVGTVNVDAGGVTPAGTIISNSSGTYTFSGGSIGGTGTVTMSSAGTLTLSGTNTHSGGTVINGGTVTLSANSGLGATNAPLTLNANATLPNSINYGTRPVVLNNGAIFFGLGISSMTIGGTISGDGGFSVANSGPQATGGKVYLTGTGNTFTGPLVLGGGNYNPAFNVASIGDAPGAGQIQFAGGYSADFIVSGGSSPIVLNYRQFKLAYNWHTPFIGNNNSGDADTLTVNTDLLVTATENLTFTLGGSNTGTNTFAGAITNGSAVISVTKSGTGKWILSGINTYSGITTISAGTLVVNNSLAIQNSTMTFNAGTLNFGTPTSAIFGGLAGSQALVLTNSAGSAVALTVGGNGSSTTYSGGISGSGSLSKTGDGTLTLSVANTYSGATTISAGTLSLTGSLTGGTAIYIGGSAILDEGAAGVISGAATLTHNSSGTSIIAGVNTYTGATTISNGTLRLTGAGSLASTNIVICPSGILDVTGKSPYVMTSANTHTFVITNSSVGRINAGSLNITSGNIAISGTPSTGVVLASYTNLTGSAFATTSGVPAGWTINYTFNGNQILLVEQTSTPSVANAGTTNQTAASCTLQGLLTTGGYANAWICWGTNDAGTTATSAWQNVASVGSVLQGVTFSTVASPLSTNVTYWYRCYASNSYGTAWASPATWFNATPASGGGGGAGYKMKISFTNYNRAETLTNFPALVVLSNGMAGTTFNFGTFLTTNGYDLRFWDETETTNLNYEIESWSTGSSAYVWVQVTNFTNNCYIWASWGDSTQTNRPAYTTNGATWDSSYLGVWHMASTALMDSTSNNLSGTMTGISNTIGVAATGQYFDDGDQIVIPNAARFSGNMTDILWFKGNYSSGGSEGAMLIDRRTASGNVVVLDQSPDGAIFLQTGFGGNSSRTGLNDGNWHQIAITFPVSSATGRLYVDGVESLQATAAVTWPAQQFELGKSHDAYWKKFIGTMDEFEVSAGFRSSNWIWACYMNMASNSFFNTPGAVQVLGGSIQNLAPTAITNNSAVLNASVFCASTNFDVYVHWGTVNGTNNFSAWTASAWVGLYSNVASTNICYTNNSLSSGSTYYYTFRATNATTNIWASPSWMFSTVGSGDPGCVLFLFH